MLKNISLGEKIFTVCNYIFLFFICFITLYPFVNITAVSLSGKIPVLRGEVTFFPRDITIAAYKMVLENGLIGVAYKNTLIIVIVGTLLSMTLTAFAAYPLSKKYFIGRNAITFMIALTLWFGGGMIPTFLVVNAVGLYDSLWALMLPNAVSAFHVIIMRNFFQSLPESLEESARIDGCNDAGVLFRIVLPLSKPILATVGLWVAVSHWNSFFDALLYLKSRNNFTLQIVLREIVLANTGGAMGVGVNLDSGEFEIIPESVKYATILAATLPILLVYPFIQKYFVKGVLIGSVKG